MCERHSFIVTRAGKVLDGYGITDSHTTICAVHGVDEDQVCKYEWRPQPDWPNCSALDGIVKDSITFVEKAKHLNAIESHIKALYPDMAAWDAGDAPRLPDTLTEWPDDLVIREGATLTAPALAEVSGSVYVQQGATFTAPILKH